jgi:hypothetical protein
MIYRFIKKMDTKKKLGKRIITSLITEEKRRKLERYLKDGPRRKMIRQVSDAETSHLEEILQICLQHISPVTAPLALLSQVSCSGGSLLGRLLDGHSNLHTYPHSFAVEAPDNDSWPEIDIKVKPEEWLKLFSKAITVTGIREGFKQDEEDKARFPFIYLPILEKQLFIKYLESIRPLNTRHVFNAHMTACLGAWINYQNHGPDKKFITAYAPGLSMHNQAKNNFFEIYPDGRLISIIRDPVDWFVSASRREPQIYGDVESALNLWKKCVRGTMEAREKFGDRVCLIQFESLTDHTESVMRHLAIFLGISYEEILLKQTFNGIPIQSSDSINTDHSLGKRYGFTESGTLDKDQRVLIEEMTVAEYQSALQHVVAS